MKIGEIFCGFSRGICRGSYVAGVSTPESNEPIIREAAKKLSPFLNALPYFFCLVTVPTAIMPNEGGGGLLRP